MTKRSNFSVYPMERTLHNSYLSTNNNTARQSTLLHRAVIGWNICRATKYFSCFCAPARHNAKSKTNGPDFIQEFFFMLFKLFCQRLFFTFCNFCLFKTSSFVKFSQTISHHLQPKVKVIYPKHFLIPSIG